MEAFSKLTNRRACFSFENKALRLALRTDKSNECHYLEALITGVFSQPYSFLADI